MAEWSKAADCKSVRLISRWFESNPSQLVVNIVNKKSKKPYLLKKFQKLDILKIKVRKVQLTNAKKIREANLGLLTCHLGWNIRVLNHFYFATLLVTTSRGWLDKDKNNKNTFNLDLKFKRNRFFPQLRLGWFDCKTIFNLSLGILARKFSTKKKFINSKSSYILSASYLRRFLVTISNIKIILKIVGLPIYLVEIIKTLLNQSNALYKDPYNNRKLINEKINNKTLNIEGLHFVRNKNFGKLKKKKIGRLKRKISKRIKNINNLLD